MAAFFNPVLATRIATPSDESPAIRLVLQRAHLSAELRPSAQMKAQTIAARMTATSELRLPLLREAQEHPVCSSPLGESAGGEANNFLLTDNWKFKTLILLDSTLKPEQLIKESVCALELDG
jgi:hypothetical protein